MKPYKNTFRLRILFMRDEVGGWRSLAIVVELANQYYEPTGHETRLSAASHPSQAVYDMRPKLCNNYYIGA
jgi:hypothetical protein